MSHWPPPFRVFRTFEESQAWAKSERERLAKCHAVDAQFIAAARREMELEIMKSRGEI